MSATRWGQVSCPMAVLILCGLASAQEKPAEPEKGMLITFDNLQNSAVLDQAGQQIGELSDVVVNASDGKIRYAAVKSSDFAKRGDELVAVPWSLLASEKGKMSLTLTVEEAVLKDAPGFVEDQTWPASPDESFWNEVAGNKWKDQAAGQGTRLSNLPGTKINSDEGKEVGEIDAAVVDLGEGKVIFTTVAVGGFAGIGESTVAVPLEGMELGEPKSKDGEKHFQLKFAEDKVKAAPRVSGDSTDKNLQQRVKRFFSLTEDE